MMESGGALPGFMEPVCLYGARIRSVITAAHANATVWHVLLSSAVLLLQTSKTEGEVSELN